MRPKDARKPNFKSQSARTMYTNFKTRTSYFTVKILRDLEKSSNFTLRKIVFEKLVYRVRALWNLKLGFLASSDITQHEKIFKSHLQVLPLSFHLSRPGAYMDDKRCKSGISPGDNDEEGGHDDDDNEEEDAEDLSHLRLG